MQNIENGSFLISHPTLLEDSFFKAIVLVTHHNFEEGQMIVVNWATGVAVIRNAYIINKYE